MPTYLLGPPSDLTATEVEVDGQTFVLLEWSDVTPRALDNLSEAEADILAGILRGESNAEIARRRHTKTRTVANQIASIFRKLGVRSRAELMAKLLDL